LPFTIAPISHPIVVTMAEMLLLIIPYEISIFVARRMEARRDISLQVDTTN
jgi:Sec-independent protein secretion pathway component TatC